MPEFQKNTILKTITIIVMCLISNLVFSQSLNLGFLFKPGITVGGEYTPDANFNDSSSLQLNKYRIQATIPLKTKLGIDLKKLDLKASQTFLTINGSMRQPNFTNASIGNQNIYTLSTGITGITAGLRNGIWLYSGNVYISESENSIKNSVQINALGYFAKIKIANLKTVYFYGAAAMFNFGKPFAIPIVGLRTKLSKKWRLTAVLPVQAKVTYKINKKSNLQMGSTFSGLNPVYRDVNNTLINYRQLKNHLIFNTEITKKLKLSIEGGYSVLKNISFYKDKENLYDYNINPTPYGSISINYIFGKSLLDMKLEGID